MKIKLISIVVNAMLLVSCSPAVVKTSKPVVISNTETAPMTGSLIATESVFASTQSPAGSEVSFSKDIWPVLKKFAVKAHGGLGGVNLESYDDVLKYVVPGNPEKSELYKDLTGNGAEQMPPGKPLPPETIQLFYDWIKQGAKNN
jgi:hypothetical protein